MYTKGKNVPLSSDMQSKEKLAVYVYEYLVHCGAKNSAQAFLNETRLDKNTQITEAPGFLLSWWNVFWDLYCAAPERRDGIESSNEAKAFLDMVPNNHQGNMIPGQQFNRYHTGPRSARNSSSGMEFSGPNANGPGGNPMNMDPSRMNPMNRLTPPGNARGPPPPPQGPPQQQMGGGPPGPNQVLPQGQQFRGQQQPPGAPNQQQQPQPIPNQIHSNSPMSPMPMYQQQHQQHQPQHQPQQQHHQHQQQHPQQQSQRWINPANPQQATPQNSLNYSSPSPAPYNVSLASSGNGGPGTPNIIPSPQQDSSNMMPNNQGMQYQDPSHMVPINSESHLNGEILESMKNSPIQAMPNNGGPVRHQEEQQQQHSNMGGPNSTMNDLNYNFADNIF